jgi:hypothetical protein
MRRAEVEGALEDDEPPALPEAVDRDELQPPAAGSGPLFHRTYRVRVRDGRLRPEEIVARIAADPDRVAPRELASFNKVRGEEGEMRVGDEYVVRMPGPWDGPVRVVQVTPTSFRLATLSGHLEAGQIEFRADREGDRVAFTIESWARSGDRLSDLLYGHLRMAKEVQLHMWTSFLERVVELTEGRRDGLLEVHTRRTDGASHVGA